MNGYRPAAYNEVFSPAGDPREAARTLWEALRDLPADDLAARQARAAAASLEQGITFSVCDDEPGTERIFPLDAIPRLVVPEDWRRITRGIEQRVRALKLFLADIDGPQRVLGAGPVPPTPCWAAGCTGGRCTGSRCPGGSARTWPASTSPEAAAAPDGPTLAVLTPGVHNSAYFEHSFRAKKTGVELVEGRDLLVRDAVLCMRTTRGLRPVDALHRRV